MSPTVQVVLSSLVAFLGGGALAWRLLGRSRGKGCPTLAKELTDKVHNRCSAYRLLEERINGVIEDFDRREHDLRAEMANASPAATTPVAMPVQEPIAVAAPAAVPMESVTGSEALEWMDSLDGPLGAVPTPARAARTTAPATPTPCTDEIVREEGWANDTEGVVDQFGRRLQILQREKSAELERQRAWVSTLEGRIQALEAYIRTVPPEVRAAPARSAEPVVAANPAAARYEAGFRAVYDRIARTERDLAAWYEYHGNLARERLASIEGLREIATSAGMAPERPRAVPPPAPFRVPQPTYAPQSSYAPPPTYVQPPTYVEDRAMPRAPFAPAPLRPAAEPVADARPSLDDLPSPLDTNRGALAGRATGGSPSGIAQLMRNLEMAQGETDAYRKKLREQETQFTAAYSMLERVRPLVHALETELTSNIRAGGRG